MKKIVIGATGLLLLLLAACSPQPLQTIGSSKYYVQIDDEGKEYASGDYTRYEYNLTGFDKDGTGEELLFTAGHQLKQGAFLQVYYKKDEVVTYEEVDDDDVPEKAMNLLT